MRNTALLTAATLTGLAMNAAPAAATPTVPVVDAQVFVHHPPGASKPDDITELDNLIYVTYQNNAGKDGTPAGSASTILAFDSSGKTVASYTIPGRCDGLTADPSHHRILATANEDLNSSLYVIQPGVAAATHYTYSPNPGQTGSDGQNGGTDAVSVARNGTIYVAHSNPDPKLPAPNNPAAVYTMTLTGSTARLTPLFGVNDAAPPVATAAAGATPLGLTDPDSNTYLPGLNGGTLVQDAQADSKLVFATHLGAGAPVLRQLALTNATPPDVKGASSATTPQLDDLAQISGPGTLYAVDQGASARIYAIDTAAFTPGTLVVSQPAPSTGDLPNAPGLGILDPATGVVTRLATPLTSPKGLLFIPSAQQPATSKAAAAGTSSKLGHRAAITIGAAGAALLVVLVSVAAVLRRRRRT